MYEIVTNEGSINVLSNGKVARTIPKGQQTATEQAEVVQLAALGTAISFNLPVSTTVDGVASATLGELASKLSSFKRGGGGGGGATVDFVNQRAPLLGNGMFLVGSAEGNVGRRPRPSDNGLTAVSNVSVKASGSDTYEMVAFTAAATNFSLAYRGSSGTFAVSDANAVGNPVTLGQYQGITNNALTSTETNATLNAMYPSIAINSEVRSITNKIKYIKKISYTMGTNTNERNALIEVETITPVIDTDGYPKTHLYYDSRDGNKFYRGMEPVEVGTEQIEGEDGDFVTVPVHEDRPILVAVIKESNIVRVVGV